MSNRVNIRTVTGNKHSPLLPSKFQRVQNRAAAIWDAWNEDGRGLALELVAHLHRISAEQIYYDIYGNPSDVDKRFGIEDSTKLERTLHVCLKEIEQGIDSSLVAVANHVPFYLIHQLQDPRDIKTLANDFLRKMNNKLEEVQQKHRQQLFESIDRMVRASTQMTNTCSSTDTIHSCQIESQSVTPAQTESTFGNVQSDQQNNHSESLTISTNDKQTVSKHSMRSYHRTSTSAVPDLMNWTCLKQHGIGLENCGRKKSQQNICYLNAIIQCLANTAPFAQWLLRDANDDQCTYVFHERIC
ncbi:unnamed protein product [Rotaria sp. Silwood1]|nr:unnamed protein product [Rotaria sp. Silwood1]